jgi:membrane protein DedA with SNARE-associated domain
VPVPFPTSVFFAAAGATNYSAGRFLAVVTVCRAARYRAIAVVADYYGGHFVHILRHPAQDWQWLLMLAAIVFTLVLAGFLLNRRLAPAYSGSYKSGWQGTEKRDMGRA